MSLGLKYWLLICVILSAGGWILSALKSLNRIGYVVLFILGAGTLFLLFRHSPGRPQNFAMQLRKELRRFKRWCPFLFLVLFLLSLLSGIIHEPTHGDTYSYRVPRVLHWLSEQHWHWIRAVDIRINAVATGTEWLWAPGFLFLPGERWLFLFNIISFAFLPGLIFALMVRLGVSPRKAWWWMWLLPAGYCYAMQAGGVATDSYSTVFALAAVVYALKSISQGEVRHFWLSAFAAALLTNTKQTNILLLPLWFIPFLWGTPALLKRPALSAFALAVALLASVVPITCLNLIHTGSWKGFPAELMVPKTPLWGLAGNALMIPAQNLVPPFFPWSNQWNGAMQQFLATPLGQNFITFEEFGFLPRGVSETNAALGFSTTALLLLTFVGFYSRRVSRLPLHPVKSIYNPVRIALVLLPWFLLLIFMAKVGVATNGRYLAPLYPFLIIGPLLFTGQHFRARWWRIAAALSLLTTISLLIISRQRPLLPVVSFCEVALARFPEKLFFQKVKNAFEFHADPRRAMMELVEKIPATEKVVGYATIVGGFEIGLWQPFGSRKVERFAPSDTREYIKSRGARYILLEDVAITASGAKILETWLEAYHAKLIFSRQFRRGGPETPPATAHIVELQ